MRSNLERAYDGSSLFIKSNLCLKNLATTTQYSLYPDPIFDIRRTRCFKHKKQFAAQHSHLSLAFVFFGGFFMRLFPMITSRFKYGGKWLSVAGWKGGRRGVGGPPLYSLKVCTLTALHGKKQSTNTKFQKHKNIV